MWFYIIMIYALWLLATAVHVSRKDGQWDFMCIHITCCKNRSRFFGRDITSTRNNHPVNVWETFGLYAPLVYAVRHVQQAECFTSFLIRYQCCKKADLPVLHGPRKILVLQILWSSWQRWALLVTKVLLPWYFFHTVTKCLFFHSGLWGGVWKRQ